jgi:hypothetical protein
MLDIMELNHALQDAQGKTRVNKYIGSARCQKDIENLSKINMSDSEIAYVIDVPLTFIQRAKQKIWKANAEKRKFLTTGIIPYSEGGYYAILPRK